jgi:PelA/Pel-15E family pectate lyase
VGVSAGGSAGSAGSAGAAVVPAVDCSLAGTVPITVAWSAINSQPAEWYASAEALTLADNIVYYQNADKGWPKAVDMTERAQPKDDSTIDNGATTTQIRLLARVFSASGCAVYGDAALDGIGYLLEAQYPNGGWPQYYPDPTGYHAHITFNDNAMLHVLQLLRSVSLQEEPYSWAESTLAVEAGAAVESGIDCILKCQIVQDGKKTGWCAQHDEVTLEPAQARTYELPSLSGSEGAGLLSFLMTIDDPSAEVREAVEGAAAWFEQVTITGIRIDETVDATQPTGEDRIVVEDPAAPPIWARFYELGTNIPIFSSRCEVPECDADPFYMRRYSLAEIDNERRVGYAWYGDWPGDVLGTEYPAWVERWEP